METATKFTSTQDAAKGIVGPDSKDQVIKVMDAAEVTANGLVKSIKAFDIMLQAVKLSDLAEEIGGSKMDVAALVVEAAIIMPDILEELAWEQSYLCLDYMRKVVYSIGPATRGVKKGKDSDIHWRLRVLTSMTDAQMTKYRDTDFASISGHVKAAAVVATENDNHKARLHDIFNKIKLDSAGKRNVAGMFIISTYKNGSAPTNAPKVVDGVLNLTVKQATIIALFVLAKFTKLATTMGNDVFTPLAGAIFPRDKLDDMMQDADLAQVFATKGDLIDSINKSAQNGGQFIDGARADLAAVCAITGTMNITKLTERKAIVTRTVKQFSNQGRPLDKNVFEAMCKYATGGVPMEWSFEVLDQEYKDIKRRQLDQALKQTAVRANSQLSGVAQNIAGGSGN